jgi:hypothetical protein
MQGACDMLVKVDDPKLRAVQKRVFCDGVDITCECFEVNINPDEPWDNYAKVYIKGPDGKLVHDPITDSVKWKIVTGKLRIEPSIEELKRIKNGAST